ncbi:hypothetical protein EX30DRAFT_199041 [Ascodesmis nigricans]|uniref:Uncharacterized protein n=1 Tax=Ascodesmis nigricans TaxID=341454 RepID=A0A4S2MKN9_9PEZI|nr:hypothetical protein EX30DRAFT_199041 [Ascodesmis nigricans]
MSQEPCSTLPLSHGHLSLSLSLSLSFFRSLAPVTFTVRRERDTSQDDVRDTGQTVKRTDTTSACLRLPRQHAYLVPRYTARM